MRPTPIPIIALLLLATAGCTMVPAYHRPEPGLAPAWPKVPGYAPEPDRASHGPAADIGWRDFFRDARLQELIGLALTNNPNLQAATFNVEQTRDLYRVQRNNLIPSVMAGASEESQRIPNIFGGGQAISYNQYTVDLGVTSYELDLFGQVRSLNQQALETYFASREARRSAQIALVAQVAEAYFTVQQATRQLNVARGGLNAAHQALFLTRRSFESGVLTQVDVNSAVNQEQTARNQVAAYTQQLALAQDNLVLLVGQPLPGNIPAQSSFDPQSCLADIPSGLPSDLLVRRPDVLEAEHQLKAANANIGAARAAFFPSITLTGSGGTSSTALGSLFAPGSQTWTFAPQVNWPIFSADTIWNQLKASRAVEQMDVANYKSAVQSAFREVADALAVRATVRTQLEANQAQLRASEQTYQLTSAGLHSGINSALDVLAARQTLDAARQNLIQSQYARLTSLINLYQVLGGGWREQTPQSPAVTPQQPPR